MRCSKCGSDNLAAKKFCEDCGAPLVNTCPKCGTETTAGKGFCGECGAPLAAISVNVEPRESSLTGERRHLTVLFCDLVGSTEIAAQLDPEEWRELVAGYHRAAANAITRYDGHVAKYLGDGVMAYFGWPEAHENDAERAARAGLAILEGVSKLNQEATRLKIFVRVGIDSGAVVVGRGAGNEADVFGEAPNIAARVQMAAAPNTVLITAATHRLLSGFFVVEEPGAQQLKGVAAPVELYRVVRPTGVRSRTAARALIPFVGREEELGVLLSRWRRVRDGEGQMALVIGEPGIGKSRLVAEFHDHIRDTRHIWLESAGEQFFENTPFHGIIEMLSRWLDLQDAANAEERCERLDRALASTGLIVAETAPLIAELQQLPAAERYPASRLAPEQKRRQLLAALTGWIMGAAKLQPLVMVVEDLHWLDPSTLELLQLLAGQGATVPLMLLFTARPEFRAPWPMRTHHSEITLNRLSSSNVREMVALVAARNALASETVEVVVERTSGVPLFVEELTRAVLESGGDCLSAHEIPVTLHDSLMARLDRLGPPKETLQIGAVIGSEFSYELLHAVRQIPEEALQHELLTLSNSDLLYVHGVAPDTIYLFKHALIRDAAYEALLKSRRKELHRLVARTIDEKFPALKEAHPEVLARHWTEAGDAEQAIAEWSRAGRAAAATNAFKEAEESYGQAMRLLRLLPQSRERALREQSLWQSLYRCFQITRSFAAPETINALEHALTLAETSDDVSELASLVAMRATTSVLSGDLAAAIPLARRAAQLAIRDRSRSGTGVYSALMITNYWSGEFGAAEQDFTAASMLWADPSVRHRERSYPYAVRIPFLAYASWNAWTLGRADLALKRVAEMMTGLDANRPYDLAWSGYYAAHLHLFMRDEVRSAALAEQALELSVKHQFPFTDAASRCVLGLARAQLGRADEGAALIREGVAKLFKSGTRLLVGNFTAYLAAAQQRQGLPRQALETVEEALRVNPDVLAYRPEMLRLRGELRLELGQIEKAGSDFNEALALGQKLGAKAWELRATTSLARLLAREGRRDEARAMLAESYNWFTEGFDTGDLKEAKSLLEELGAEPASIPEPKARAT
jgi:class 3 adenylate cyclase/tetratricopeptide (TPR) repeat protein